MASVGNRSVDVSESRNITSCLEDLSEQAIERLPQEQRAQRRAQQQYGHGVVVATFGEPLRVFEAFVGEPCLAREASGLIIGGDQYNPARLIPTYYYSRCAKSVPECLSIGIHTMRLAVTLNTAFLDGLEAWVYDGADFR